MFFDVCALILFYIAVNEMCFRRVQSPYIVRKIRVQCNRFGIAETELNIPIRKKSGPKQ